MNYRELDVYIRSQNTVESDSTNEWESECILPRIGSILLAHVNLKNNTGAFEDSEVYKRSYRLALEIHKFSLSLPRYLQFDIGDQIRKLVSRRLEIRRASRSIPSDIAEAYARAKSNKDKVNLLSDALGSNEEMLFNLDFFRCPVSRRL